MGGDLMHGFAGLEALMAQVGDGRLRPADSDDGAGGGRGIGKGSTGGRGGAPPPLSQKRQLADFCLRGAVALPSR